MDSSNSGLGTRSAVGSAGLREKKTHSDPAYRSGEGFQEEAVQALQHLVVPPFSGGTWWVCGGAPE